MVRGIGEKRAEILRTECAINTAGDLLLYRPRRYLDHSYMAKIIDLDRDITASVMVTIMKVAVTGRNRSILKISAHDGSAPLTVVFFGGIRYFSQLFQEGMQVLFSGKVGWNAGCFQMTHPEFDILAEAGDATGADTVNTGRIVPVYRVSEAMRGGGFSTRVLRRTILQLLNDLQLPDAVLAGAVRQVHFPDSAEALETARRTLAARELFFFQKRLHRARLENRGTRSAHRIPSDPDAFAALLPFALTSGQQSAISDIAHDLNGDHPMNRMIQGDVGCGKTVVAAFAVSAAIQSGGQAAVMAPTEILARQLYITLVRILGDADSIGYLSSAVTKKNREEMARRAEAGEISVIVGTHALTEEYVRFKDLRLVVIDEQHRFGVAQREALGAKGSIPPHLLTLSATPIPRSLALTLYGDLDISTIEGLPAGRGAVHTMIFPRSRLAGIFNSVRKYVSQGRQAIMVLPLVDAGTSARTSAKGLFEDLSKGAFSDIPLGLLHGRMKPEEKNSVIESFRAGETSILVATTVIEVGIDIPNANTIVILHAELFGLAQLHQLRGRVGRGSHESFCVLVHEDDAAPESLERLRVMEQTRDGFAISEADLRMRGSGEIAGERQSGFADEFIFADLLRDIDLIRSMRDTAIAKVESETDGTEDECFFT